MVRGYSRDPNNLFRWDNIRLNLPGDPSYSPTIMLMSKVQGGTQDMAAYFTTYVDDSILVAGSAKEAWRSARRVGSIWKYLGYKYSPRKRRIAGQERGPWRGTKVQIIDDSIYELIKEEKWAKNRLIIKKMSAKGCIRRTPGLQRVAK